MASIRFISTSTVRPASHNESTQRIELTPWDLRLLLIGSIQKGLVFLKPTLQQETELKNTLIHHLKTSLSRTLDFFYPLAGRLTATNHDDYTNSFFIDCNGTGAEFVHAVADDVTVADFLKPVYDPDIVQSFFPLNGDVNLEGTSKPLLAIQVTELVDGVFIGCSINHTVADGTSFWHFVNSWSEIARGSDHISNPPLLQRWFPDGTDFPIRFHLPQDEQLSERFTPPPKLKGRVFNFSKEKIAHLKAKANAEMGTNRISSLQALLAHLWRAVIRNRHLKADQEISYGLAVGHRQRLHPPLPSHYFGNALKAGSATMKAGELLDEQGLGRGAWKMNQMIALQTDQSVRKFLESWVKNPTFITINNIGAENALLSGGSPRFDVYGNDFGWGTPVAVRSGGNKFDGKIVVFAGVEEGSVVLDTCLSAPTLEAMGVDAEFMDAVCK